MSVREEKVNKKEKRRRRHGWVGERGKKDEMRSGKRERGERILGKRG